jgi:hypothetical protein
MDEFRRRLMMIPKSHEIDYENYLTIEALEDGLEVSFTNDLYYNKDGEWVLLSTGSSTPPIVSGEKIAFKGELTPSTSSGVGTFTITKKCNLLGNCMSLLFGDNAKGVVSLSGYDYAFRKLFENCASIVGVSESFLPATTLSEFCYYRMFYGCKSMKTHPALPAETMMACCYSYMFAYCSALEDTPALPATTLAAQCYARMFYYATGLVFYPPALPATTLAQQCYEYMFYQCNKLRISPTLPAPILVAQCYRYMFYGCSGMTGITMLATDISAFGCLSSWVSGVASSGTFTKSKKATWNVTGASGIPSGWTVKTA